MCASVCGSFHIFNNFWWFKSFMKLNLQRLNFRFSLLFLFLLTLVKSIRNSIIIVWWKSSKSSFARGVFFCVFFILFRWTALDSILIPKWKTWFYRVFVLYTSNQNVKNSHHLPTGRPQTHNNRQQGVKIRWKMWKEISSTAADTHESHWGIEMNLLKLIHLEKWEGKLPEFSRLKVVLLFFRSVVRRGTRDM